MTETISRGAANQAGARTDLDAYAKVAVATTISRDAAAPRVGISWARRAKGGQKLPTTRELLSMRRSGAPR